jgi:hypothetical protein
LNRINRFILIFISLVLSALVVYLYVRENMGVEPLEILAPLKIEAYRLDRYYLTDADVYLNQRFIGKTDRSGILRKDIRLTVGESYTLRIERDSGGYVYGPWETRFRVEGEGEDRKRKRAREPEPSVTSPSLEGDFDILTELERAQEGKASGYEKYNFLAILDGYMFYEVEVTERDGSPSRNASVIIDGKEAGKTNNRGSARIKYSGEDRRHENIKVLKKGEHIWMNDMLVYPDARLKVKLSTILLVDLYSYTEYYDSIMGIEGASVFMGGRYMGTTDRSGLCSFKYENEEGVEGYLELFIYYPEGIIPDRIKRGYLVTAALPKLTIVEFAYSESPIPPKIAVLPIRADDNKDPQLIKIAGSMRTSLEDYLSSGGIFSTVPYRSTN